MSAALLERLDRIERQLATLLARGAGVRTDGARTRVSKDTAAVMLNCSKRQVDRYASRGLLAKLPKGPKDRTTYFDPASVDALVASEDAAREWIARRKYVPKGKIR